ncbi:hypothetical protein SteCoe_37204 [Stentor coeruleus]|uniref:Uncharacterized protein n=1 Tax=Stentor coeruleus TaxID=5963 RepID=A0A1R2ANL7_9CILI|nr:hypothetical protein SteCoe_37204 [Stentor coeruleus]
METTLPLYSRDASIKLPRTPNTKLNLGNDKLINPMFIMGKNKLLKDFTLDQKNFQLTPRGHIKNKQQQKDTPKVRKSIIDAIKKPTIQALDRSDLEQAFKPGNFRATQVFVPERYLGRKTAKRTIFSNSIVKNISQSFDLSNEPKENISKLNEQNKIPVPRKAPARFLPAIDIKITKADAVNVQPVQTLKKELLTLLENNEKLNREFLLEKKHRANVNEIAIPSINRRMNDEHWGWQTPNYSPLINEVEVFE